MDMLFYLEKNKMYIETRRKLTECCGDYPKQLKRLCKYAVTRGKFGKLPTASTLDI